MLMFGALVPLIFLSTPSVRRATTGSRRFHSFFQFLSTPSVRRATKFVVDIVFRQHISIHALRTEGDASSTVMVLPSTEFLSTPSVRRATGGGRSRAQEGKISIHALRTEGDFLPSSPAARPADFYPRPPYGGRQLTIFLGLRPGLFLSTPSVRRATTTCWTPSTSIEFLSTPSVRRATG